MITRSSIAFEDFLGSSIAPQVMPPWLDILLIFHFDNNLHKRLTLERHQALFMRVLKLSQSRRFSRLLRVGWLDCRQGSIILELNKTELSLPRLLIDQVVVVLRRDVERVAFLRIELSGVQDDGDLPLENNKHHRVLVCAAHPLGRVALDPEEGEEMVGRLRALAYCTASGAIW